VQKKKTVIVTAKLLEEQTIARTSTMDEEKPLSYKKTNSIL
jgi:hypothetical protein